MTSPCEVIEVRCPCGTTYETVYRASVNLDLDPDLGDPAYLEKVSTGTCPECGRVIELGGLAVRGDVWEWR